MKVIKVLNNSVLMAVDDAGNEVILMGKGLGYAKSIGCDLNDAEIEKVFVLRDRSLLNDIIRLATEIDSLYFELARATIDYAVQKYHMKLMDHIYLSLTDHISFAVRRFQENKAFRSFYFLEMKQFNPRECEIAKYCLDLIEERVGVRLPDGELGYIAFHFINAQQNNPYRDMDLQILEVVQDILDIIKYDLKIVYDTDSIAYSRLVTHLRLFAQRAVTGSFVKDNEQDFLYDQIIDTCQQSYKCVKKIGIYINKQFHVTLTKQEELYLVIYIHRLMGLL